MKSHERLAERPRMMKEVAAAYGVDRRTLINWLNMKGLQELISRKRKNGSYYFTILELKAITDAIGEPWPDDE